ncbi:MAG: DUF296 domain-containing protein [Planctomycetota bacterium]
MVREVTRGRCFVGRLRYGSDLLTELTGICWSEKVTLGRLEFIGAVTKARLGYYDQPEKKYRFFMIDKPLEILKGTGNVSLRDGEPMVHAHLTLADADGRAWGGHLAPGTIVFACEFFLQALEGATLARGHDEETGLPLWTMDET